jgi:hypothetical protein
VEHNGLLLELVLFVPSIWKDLWRAEGFGVRVALGLPQERIIRSPGLRRTFAGAEVGMARSVVQEGAVEGLGERIGCEITIQCGKGTRKIDVSEKKNTFQSSLFRFSFKT